MSTTINGLRSNLKRSDLIDETIALVQGHKKKDGLVWDQTSWTRPADCGTACCVAGGAAVAAGYVLHSTETYGDTRFDNEFQWRRPRGKTVYGIATLGRKLLGLDGFEAEWLFHSDRTKRQVLAGLRKLKDGGRINELRSFRTHIKDMYGLPSRTSFGGTLVPAVDGWDYYRSKVAA